MVKVVLYAQLVSNVVKIDVLLINLECYNTLTLVVIASKTVKHAKDLSKMTA